MQREYGFDFEGELPTLPAAYQNNPVLMRGCFVLAVPDRKGFKNAIFTNFYK